MSSQTRHVVRREDGAAQTFLRGPARVIMGAVRQVNVPWGWDNTRHAVTIARPYVDAVSTAILAAGHDVTEPLAWPTE